MTSADNPLFSPPGAGLIVEFFGVTGVGKTALVAAVKAKLQAQGYAVHEAQEVLVTSYFGYGFRRWPKLQSLAAHLLVVPPFVRYLLSRQGFRLSRLAMRSIAEGAGTFRIAVSLLRNFVKRIGSYFLLTRLRRKLPASTLILCDEGIVQAAHNLFVHVGSRPPAGAIAFFATLVPKPDLLVWVRAPQAQSVACILQRGHRRVDGTPAAAQAFVAHAVHTFDVLCAQETLKGRLFAIDNAAASEPAQRAAALDATAGKIVSYLTGRLAPERERSH